MNQTATPEAAKPFPISIQVAEPRSPTMAAAAAAHQFATALVVADDDSYHFADQQLAELKGRLRTLEAERRAIVDPINASVAKINDLYRPARTFYETAEALIKQRMLTYRTQQEEARRKAEREAQAKADAEQRARDAEAMRQSEEAAARGDAEGAQRILEDAVVPPPPPVVDAPPPPKADRSSVRKVWKATGKDLDVTIKAAAAGDRNARACLCFDEQEMGKRVRALGADFKVPGVEVREESVLSSRAVR